MTIEELMEKIVRYVTRESWEESMFFTSEPQFYVHSGGLLDFLVEETGIPKEKFAEWSNDEADKVEAKK